MIAKVVNQRRQIELLTPVLKWPRRRSDNTWHDLDRLTHPLETLQQEVLSLRSEGER